MNIRVAGDEIRVNGYVVAVLSTKCPVSIRDKFVALLRHMADRLEVSYDADD